MTTVPEPTETHATPPAVEIVVYARPGCPYCTTLRVHLRRSGVNFREVDIWDDPAAAAFVRSVARGNETVPTVTIGHTTIVNPSARRVLELAGGASDNPRSARRRWFSRQTR